MKTCSICPKPATDYYGLHAYVNCVDGRHIDLHAKAILETRTQDRSGGHYGPCIPGPLCAEHYIQILESLSKEVQGQIRLLKAVAE